MVGDRSEITLRRNGLIIPVNCDDGSDGTTTASSLTIQSKGETPFESLSFDVYRGEERLHGDSWDAAGNALFRDQSGAVAVKLLKEISVAGLPNIRASVHDEAPGAMMGQPLPERGGPLRVRFARQFRRPNEALSRG